MDSEETPAPRKRQSGQLANRSKGSDGSIRSAQGAQPDISSQAAVDGTIVGAVATQIVSAEIRQIAALPSAVSAERQNRAGEFEVVSNAAFAEIMATSPLGGLLGFIVSS